MEEKNSQILFRNEKKSNQWFCIHDTDKYHIKVFFKSFSNVKYKKKIGVKLRMVGSCLNSCRKLIEYLTKNSSSVRIYHWQNIVFSLIFLLELATVIFIIVYDFFLISHNKFLYKIDGINEFWCHRTRRGEIIWRGDTNSYISL